MSITHSKRGPRYPASVAVPSIFFSLIELKPDLPEGPEPSNLWLLYCSLIELANVRSCQFYLSVKKILDTNSCQSYRLLVASRLFWLPYPGFRVKVSRFSEILGRACQNCEVETLKRAI
jgi:hypothetical protein